MLHDRQGGRRRLRACVRQDRGSSWGLVEGRPFPWTGAGLVGAASLLGVAMVASCGFHTGDDSSATGTPTTPADTPVESPTMDTCEAWLKDSSGLQVPEEACEGDWDTFRAELQALGGGVFPVGDGRYFLVYFPTGWAPETGKMVVALHGTGGCAEWMLNWWYQATTGVRTYALAALQYYDRSTGEYDDDATIYANLQSMMAQLRGHCPLETTHVFYHGFSRGSAQSFPVAVRDRAGEKIFSAFIADSGTAGLDYDTLADAPDDALTGSRFWMWCGENNCSSVPPYSSTMCERMSEDMVPYVEGHGGTVDALVQDPLGCHGVFNDCTIGEEISCPDTDCSGEHDPNCNCYDCTNRKADNLGTSLETLFAYIDSF